MGKTKEKVLCSMEEHSLNVGQSKELYRKNPNKVVVKQCYENVYKIVTSYPAPFREGRWKVAFGYMDSGVAGLLLRHCFILDEFGRVIDPTMVAVKNKIKAELGADNEPWPHYYVMYSFSNIMEYIDVMLREKKFSFEKFLRPYDEAAWVWAMENGFALAG